MQIEPPAIYSTFRYDLLPVFSPPHLSALPAREISKLWRGPWPPELGVGEPTARLNPINYLSAFPSHRQQGPKRQNGPGGP